ncbi:hypothetical protein CRUP_026492, partial [Coryphaenoides rupestris]
MLDRPPVDRGQVTAMVVFLLGIGALLPWNFFVTATLYFNKRLEVNVTVVNVTVLNGTQAGHSNDHNFDSWMALLSMVPLLMVQERVRVAFSMVAIFLLFSLTAILVKCSVLCSREAFLVWWGCFPSRYSTLFMSDKQTSKDPEALIIPEKDAGNQQRLSVFAVFKKIWVMAACITCIFAVTLAVFPVITVKVKTFYIDYTEWDKVFTCVCCFIVFNLMDLVGRSLPSLVQWPAKESRLFPVMVFSRLLFIPLFMMCNIPNSQLPILFSNDGAYVIIMALFALSNGYLASLCMAYAPQLVHCGDCETAGASMTFFLALGLSLGAATSFLL